MSSSKNKEIEYLRGVAAILMTIMAHHHSDCCRFMRVFFDEAVSNVYSPWTGVDLFFCISGYVVSKAYLDVLR